MRHFILLAAIAALVAGCTAQQSANLEAAAVVSCNAADVAAAAAVAITADVNASKQAQTDAATAQKVTSDACTALQKLPTIAASATPAS